MTYPKPARISPDSRPIAYGAAGVAAAIYSGAFVSSFFGQASLAAYMLIPHDLQYVVPAVVDLGLILFTLATLVRKSRGESTVLTNMATGFWTLVSITANIFHVLIPAGPQSSWTAGTFAGAALSALMPLAALGASLVIENVLIAQPAPVQYTVQGAAEPTPAQERRQPIAPVVVMVEPKAEAPETVVHASVESVIAPPPAPTKARTAARRPAAAPAAALTVSVPAPRQAPMRQLVKDPSIDWAALSEAEKSELVWKLKEERMSNPNIAKKVGVSVSTIKRVPAPELQPA